MNEYGRRALEHWQRTKPQELSTIPDPEAFFSTLGETAASQVDSLADQLAGPDSPGEGYLEKVGRLRMAKYRAEEMVLAELVYSTTPEINEDDEDLDDEPRTQRWREWDQRAIQEQQEHQQQTEDAADQAWRERTGQQEPLGQRFGRIRQGSSPRLVRRPARQRISPRFDCRKTWPNRTDRRPPKNSRCSPDGRPGVRSRRSSTSPRRRPLGAHRSEMGCHRGKVTVHGRVGL